MVIRTRNHNVDVRYLTGRFPPNQHPAFVTSAKVHLDRSDRQGYRGKSGYDDGGPFPYARVMQIECHSARLLGITPRE